MIELTDGQKKGLELALLLAKKPHNVGIICGYAGTGKTTLVRSILDELQSTSVLLSPTGKAASRLTELSGRGAGTIHRWLYKPEENDDGILTFVRKNIKEIQRPSSGLIIVDEASMIGPDVWNDLQEMTTILDCSLLLVGDGFQLPPIQEKGAEPFSVLDPDFRGIHGRVELTEIVRQALDSPIIRMTMAVRTGDTFDVHDVIGDLTTMPDELDGELERADMVICRTNVARHALNTRARAVRGISGDIRLGEPLLVLKNTSGLDAYNGEVHGFSGFTDNLHFQKVFDPALKLKVEVNFQISPWGNGARAIMAPKVIDGSLSMPPFFLEKAVNYWQKEERGSERAFYMHANFGYALTCHKAQGSEADNVLVCLEPRTNYAGAEGRRWLYTALTRARKRVAVANFDVTSSP